MTATDLIAIGVLGLVSGTLFVVALYELGRILSELFHRN